MNQTRIFILAIAIGVVITAYIIWKLQKFRGTDTYQKSQRGIIKLLKWEEQMVIKFQTNVLGLFSNKKNQRIKPAFLLEIILMYYSKWKRIQFSDPNTPRLDTISRMRLVCFMEWNCSRRISSIR